MDVKDLESALADIPGGTRSCWSHVRRLLTSRENLKLVLLTLRSSRDTLMFSEGVFPTDELDQYLDTSVVGEVEETDAAARAGTIAKAVQECEIEVSDAQGGANGERCGPHAFVSCFGCNCLSYVEAAPAEAEKVEVVIPKDDQDDGEKFSQIYRRLYKKI